MMVDESPALAESIAGMAALGIGVRGAHRRRAPTPPLAERLAWVAYASELRYDDLDAVPSRPEKSHSSIRGMSGCSVRRESRSASAARWRWRRPRCGPTIHRHRTRGEPGLAAFAKWGADRYFDLNDVYVAVSHIRATDQRLHGRWRRARRASGQALIAEIVLPMSIKTAALDASDITRRGGTRRCSGCRPWRSRPAS